MNSQNFNPEYAALQLNQMLVDLFAYMATATNMSVEERIRYPDMLNGWAAGEVFRAGEYLRYGFDADGNAMIYESLRAQTAQANIPPDGEFSANAYTLVSHVNGVRRWSEPISRLDAPAVGVIRHYNGENWRNTIDGNRFSPAQIGWEKVL